MINRLGSDPDQLDRAASRFDSMAANLRQRRAEIDMRLAGTFWLGPDADEFRTEWSSQMEADFRRAADSLGTAARALRSAAWEQRRTSGG